MPKSEYFLLDMGQNPPTSQAETTVSAVVHFENYTSGKVRIMVCSVIVLFLNMYISFISKISRMCFFFSTKCHC